MSNLWVFADSYGFLPADRYDEWKNKHWYRLLSDKLGCYKDFKSISHNGCSNEWISFQIENAFQKISADDYIVIITTDKDREWFFPNNVGVSNIYINNIEKHISRNHAVAIDYYKNFLKDNYQADIRFNWYVNYIKYKFRNHQFIIVPGFENNSNSIVYNDNFSTTGTLFDICKSEIKKNDQLAWEKWIRSYGGIDPRVGHLSYQNHKVLSEKIYNCFSNLEDLDLTKDFYEEFR